MGVPGLIAKKVGMTRVIDENGKTIPVTLLEIANQKVTKVLTAERDGYSALQVGYMEKKEKQLTKADIHRLRKAQIDSNFARFRELRLEAAGDLQVGALLTLESLGEIKAVDVTGITKGRGFQGAIKRWGAARGRMTHGSDYHRRPGSLGCRTTPGRVFKNKKVPGHMGVARRTIMNLQVVNIDTAANLLAIKGSVPGHTDGYLIIRPSIKA